MCSFLNPFILQRIPPSDPLPPFLLLLSELTSRDYSLAAQPRGGPMSSNIVIPPPISRIIYEVPPPHIYCLLHPTRDAPGPPNRPLPKPPRSCLTGPSSTECGFATTDRVKGSKKQFLYLYGDYIYWDFITGWKLRFHKRG
ncbi:hypothetical protein K445DRAFT_10294 [Daldinia sp. EC12]|nr:hypothetical protein K445DRAFT_10294 [Daldinia sp. EC12]